MSPEMSPEMSSATSSAVSSKMPSKISSERLWKRVQRVFFYIVVYFIVVVSLVPFLWMLDTAIKPGIYSMVYPPVFFPPGVGLQNFHEVLTQTAQQTNFLLYFRNTVWYSFWVVIGQ